MVPMAFDEMRATGDAVRRRMPGETLTRTTPLPHDKETGAALVRVLFPEDNTAEVPVLSIALSEAISDLLAEWKRADELGCGTIQQRNDPAAYFFNIVVIANNANRQRVIRLPQ